MQQHRICAAQVCFGAWQWLGPVCAMKRMCVSWVCLYSRAFVYQRFKVPGKDATVACMCMAQCAVLQVAAKFRVPGRRADIVHVGITAFS